MNSFIDTVSALHPEYVMRVAGGGLFLLAALIMAYNIFMTIHMPADRTDSQQADIPTQPATA